MPQNKISSINGINRVPNLHNNTRSSWFLMNLDFSLTQIPQFDTSLNLFCSFLLAVEYLSAVSFTSDTVSFYCFYILQHFQEFSFLFLSQLYSSLNTLPTETNLSWLKCETIKALKIKTFITFILGFVNNTLLWCLFLFSWRLTYIFSIYAIF